MNSNQMIRFLATNYTDLSKPSLSRTGTEPCWVSIFPSLPSQLFLCNPNGKQDEVTMDVDTQLPVQNYTPPSPRLVCIESNPGPSRGRRRRNGNNTSNNNSNSITVIPRSPGQLFPARVTLKQVYTDTRDITSTSGVYASYVYRMNSTFDPDLTGAGYQPYGRDQLAAIYSKYRVNSFSWDIENYFQSDPSLSLSAGTACAPSQSSSSMTVIQNLSNMPWGRSHISTANGSVAHYRGSLPLKNFLGQTPQQFLADDSNESVVGGNPAQSCFFHIGQQNNNADTCIITWIVRLTFDVTYFAPNYAGPS
jgi:hypothetical protein